jgi:thiamine-monophosphate kinase
MIDISDGLSSEILHIAKASNLGCKIYEEKLPIAEETFKACEEFRLNAPTVALNGGEDYELLFTIPLELHDKVKDHLLFTVIGHMTEEGAPAEFITNTGNSIPITAQGWNAWSNNDGAQDLLTHE